MVTQRNILARFDKILARFDKTASGGLLITRKRRQYEGKNLRTRQQRRVAGAIALSIEPNLSPSPAGPVIDGDTLCASLV